MGIRVLGLERARVIPSQIEERLAVFRLELIPPLVEDFRRTEPRATIWPKGRRKTIQAQTRGFVRGRFVVIGAFSRFSRALDAGGTVQPRKQGGVMRFRNEENVFVFTRKPITHRPRPYFGRVLTQVPTIVGSVYERVFAGIGGH